MKKLLAALSCAAMVAIPATAHASDDTGVAIGGNYGPAPCYVSLDYWRVDVSVTSVKPFVHVTTDGSLGGEVHCPLIQN